MITVTLTFPSVAAAVLALRNVDAPAAQEPSIEELTKVAEARGKRSSAKAAPSAPTVPEVAADAPAKTAADSSLSVESAEAEHQASTAANEPSFEELKKAFLALSITDGGRAKCEAVLKPFGVAKLSELKAEQYGKAMNEVKKQAA